MDDASRIEVTPMTWQQVVRGYEFGNRSGARGKKRRAGMYGLGAAACLVVVFGASGMEMRQPLQPNGRPKYEMSDRTFEFGTGSNITGGISFVGSVPDEKIVGNEAVWDFTLQVQTPPSNVKSILVEPVWFASKPGPVPSSGSGFLPHLSQLNVTVPIN